MRKASKEVRSNEGTTERKEEVLMAADYNRKMKEERTPKKVQVPAWYLHPSVRANCQEFAKFGI